MYKPTEFGYWEECAYFGSLDYGWIIFCKWYPLTSRVGELPSIT